MQDVPVNEDPLIQSLEYTAATATARAANSSQRRVMAAQTQNAIAQLQGKVKPETWATVKAKIKTAITDAFTHVYNPEVTITDSNDGSSERGRYELVAKAGGARITSITEYPAVAKQLALAQIGASDYASGSDASAIETVLGSPEFLNALRDGNIKLPWELASGGPTDEATQVIFGGSISTQSILGGVDATTADQGARAKEILALLVKGHKDLRDEDRMATIRTVGRHGFNALPSHGTSEALRKAVREGGDGALGDKIDELVIDKATALRDTDFGHERVLQMSERDMRNRYYWQDASDACGKKLEAIRKAWKDGASMSAMTALIEETGAPQIVIADTDRGSGASHVFFVIVGDQRTREPRLYQRTDPPGDLRPATADWAAANWARVA